jgi:hypothetical protein
VPLGRHLSSNVLGFLNQINPPRQSPVKI